MKFYQFVQKNKLKLGNVPMNRKFELSLNILTDIVTFRQSLPNLISIFFSIKSLIKLKFTSHFTFRSYVFYKHKIRNELLINSES